MNDQARLESWRRWVAALRPRRVREVAERWPAWRMYTLTTTGQVVSIQSYAEDGTVTVQVHPDDNPRESYWARGLDACVLEVFGVDPHHLQARS